MKVLFVCSGNAHRSPLAEALLKKMRPDLEVDSAGLQVAIPVADEVKEYLSKQGAEEWLKKNPETLHEKRPSDYDLIVAMEERHRTQVLSLCPECRDRIMVWNVRDPYFMNREDALKVYEQIREKVVELARTL